MYQHVWANRSYAILQPKIWIFHIFFSTIKEAEFWDFQKFQRKCWGIFLFEKSSSTLNFTTYFLSAPEWTKLLVKNSLFTCQKSSAYCWLPFSELEKDDCHYSSSKPFYYLFTENINEKKILKQWVIYKPAITIFGDYHLDVFRFACKTALFFQVTND